MPSRTQYSLRNAKVGAACYLLSLLVSFFSRKIFLDHLGTVFLGFTGSVGSILGFLNIAELGISTAVSVVLYKPLFERNQLQIDEILSILGYLYRCIGCFILAVGVVVSFFLPVFFSDVNLPIGVIYLGYYSFLFSSLLGYFVNYRTILLSADQRGYVVAACSQFVTIFKVLVQIGLVYFYNSFTGYLLAEVAFGIVYSWIINRKVRQNYPTLASNLSAGKALLRQYPDIVTKVRQLCYHKIGAFVQNQSAPILIYSFVSLPMVALYGNYMLVTSSLRALFARIFEQMTSSVGNLVAEGKTEHIFEVYRQLFSFRFWIASIVSCSAYWGLSPFIRLWLGQEYVLSDSISFLVCAYLFLCLLREVTDQFLYGYGLVQDVLSPVIESLIFISVSVVGGKLWGLTGILLGPLASLVIVIFIWKPYFLFTRGFRLPVLRKYWLPFVQYLALVILSSLITTFLLSRVSLFASSDVVWTAWILRTLVSFLLFSFITLVGFSLLSKDFVSLLRRIANLSLLHS